MGTVWAVFRLQTHFIQAHVAAESVLTFLPNFAWSLANYQSLWLFHGFSIQNDFVVLISDRTDRCSYQIRISMSWVTELFLGWDQSGFYWNNK